MIILHIISMHVTSAMHVIDIVHSVISMRVTIPMHIQSIVRIISIRVTSEHDDSY